MRASACRTFAVLLSAAWIAGFALAVQPDDSTGGADSATESGASVADAADSSTASIPAPARTTRLQGSALEGRRMELLDRGMNAEEVEAKLAAGPSAQIPLNPEVQAEVATMTTTEFPN